MGYKYTDPPSKNPNMYEQGLKSVPQDCEYKNTNQYTTELDKSSWLDLNFCLRHSKFVSS